MRDAQMMCTECHIEMPITRFTRDEENLMTLRAKSILPHIVHATALVYYSQNNGWREMIHRLKYSGDSHIGNVMGEYLGCELAASPLYRDVDMVVSVPLHPIRRVTRGYNQTHYIAKVVAKKLGVPYRQGLLRRKRYNVSQVKVKRNERWRNTEGIFEVVRPEAFVEKCVLIIDDVFTTGATTVSCAESIIDAAPSCRIWIAAVAASESEYGGEPSQSIDVK